MTKQFVAAVIGAPFGLKGFVKVKTLSGETDHLLRLKSATLRQDGKEKNLEIAQSSAAAPDIVIRFVGFENPEDAKSLAGAQIIVDREEAAPLRHGEFYVEDLKGLAVFSGETTDGESENGIVLGQIAGVIEGGGGDLAEIKLKDGQMRLVPFRKEFFPEVDTEKGRAVLTNTWILE